MIFFYILTKTLFCSEIKKKPIPTLKLNSPSRTKLVNVIVQLRFVLYKFTLQIFHPPTCREFSERARLFKYKMGKRPAQQCLTKTIYITLQIC